MKAIPIFTKERWIGKDLKKKSWKSVSGPATFAKKSIAEGELIKEGMVFNIVDRDINELVGNWRQKSLQRKDTMGGIW